MRDPYSVLGVARGASQDDIKKSYRKLAKELHPDRHPGDEAAVDRFKEVSAAYDLLGDADKRARFDRGEIDADGQERGPRFHHAGAGAGGGPDDMFSGFGFGGAGPRGFEDIVGDLFGGRRGARTQARGRDRKYSLQIEFLEAARGGSRRLTLPGGKPLDVRIPAGIEEGQQIRLKGQGEPGPNGADGDALIEVSIRPHAFFRREGLDIHMELPISLAEAVLGGKVMAPTVHGDVAVAVPKGSNAGRTLRLKGKGIRKGGEEGDQYVKLKIVLPDGEDPELEAFVKGWSRGKGHDPRGGMRG
ncbi:MAG: J domain-containing protein [Pseudomonadota bacterium]|nr:J domain-containing protein [Pseudomonadota bacterium]